MGGWTRLWLVVSILWLLSIFTAEHLMLGLMKDPKEAAKWEVSLPSGEGMTVLMKPGAKTSERDEQFDRAVALLESAPQVYDGAELREHYDSYLENLERDNRIVWIIFLAPPVLLFIAGHALRWILSGFAGS